LCVRYVDLSLIPNTRSRVKQFKTDPLMIYERGLDWSGALTAGVREG
jgi:hypothetical protein